MLILFFEEDLLSIGTHTYKVRFRAGELAKDKQSVES